MRVGEGEKNRREEVDGDQSLSPQPAVVTVSLNVSPPLRLVVKVTQLHGSEISECPLVLSSSPPAAG